MRARFKRRDCEHQFDNVRHCAPAVRNTYRCDTCGEQWKDDWSCGCDDECPRCGIDISPVNSVEIASCACDHLGK
jgi:hypothetical protein